MARKFKNRVSDASRTWHPSEKSSFSVAATAMLSAMRKWFQIAFVIILVAMLSGLAWQTLRRREPTYEGRPVTAWIKEGYWPNAQGSLEEAKVQKANQAVIAIGTNALPFYLDLLATRGDSAIKFQFFKLLKRQHWLKLNFIPGWENSDGLARWYGYCALTILGDAAKPAIPALTKLLNEGDEDQVSSAAQTLTSFGLAGMAPITNFIANLHAKGRSTVVLALGMYLQRPSAYQTLQKPRTPEEVDAVAKIIVPVLITYLQDNDPQVRSSALADLSVFAYEPDVVIPTLIKIVEKEKQSQPGFWREAIFALARYGPKAKPAVPVLLPLLKDSDPRIARITAEALKAIDPEAAAKTGLQ